MNPWQPKKTIDEKKKTGDAEHLRILWDAYMSITEPTRRLEGIKSDGERKSFSSSLLPELSGELEQLSEELEGAFGDRAVASVLNRAATSVDYSSLQKVLVMLKTMSGKLGPGYNQFIVNLALFDFRTTAGGRARKSTSVLRQGSDDHYARPFQANLPAYVTLLLTAVQSARSQVSPLSSSEVVTLTPDGDVQYIPPTRFTATFPLALAGKKDGKKTLNAPQIPGQQAQGRSTVKYAFLGSFGFAEPGYCTWEKEDGAEYPGTRLSLGAYSLNPAYLKELLALLDGMGKPQAEAYAQYGGVGREHVKALLGKVEGTAGSDLAITWTLQMVDLARALNAKALEKSQTGGRLLHGFFESMKYKIDVREIKLMEARRLGAARLLKAQKQGTTQDHTLFDYIWVFESTLWELAFLGASCLSMSEIVAALKKQKVFADWQPSVGLSDLALEETVKIGGDETFDRVYFPSGSAAADIVYDVLWASGFGPFALTVDPKQLSTFTPYFEFYQQRTSLLHPEVVSGRLKQGDRRKDLQGAQMWLNLSDGLHSLFLDERPLGSQVGFRIAVEISKYIQGLCQQREGNDEIAREFGISYQDLCLVIDYTKFAGDMPNEQLYPILAQLRDTLIALQRESPKVSDVVFLRSNLKYNTGSLDRYQSGEILVDPESPVSLKLSGAAPASFKGNWDLRGEYIPLMKKMYLLSDAIGFARWAAYSQLWNGGAPLKSMVRPSPLKANLLVVKTQIVNLVDCYLASIFTNLVVDLRKNSYKSHVPAETRRKITTLWEKLQKDRDVLADFNWKASSSSELEKRVHAVTGYIGPELDEIIKELSTVLKGIPKSTGGELKPALNSYVSRLKAAKEKTVSFKDDLKAVAS